MRIMTSNVWGDFFGNPTVIRDDKLYSVYQAYSPDVIGFQEFTKGWYASSLLEKLSGEYYFVGTERFYDKFYVPMAIKKEYKLIAKGFEYLQDTPDDSKSITWAVLKHNDKTFAVCNTHFWWMRGKESESLRQRLGVLDYSLADHCRLRDKNAKQLSELMKHLADRYSCPVFAFGDMNATSEENIFEVFGEYGIVKLFDIAEQKDLSCSIHGDPEKDGNGAFFGVRATREYIAALRRDLCLTDDALDGYLSSIDHIVGLGEGVNVKQYRVIDDQNALDASDHSPVFADIELD